ncbi:LacI family DNA-binding transcriptional regulator [Paraburkholderia hospita]|uniref:LacI family DNA-binding transcriptional regulator n=1 Tax=Paraburkholderia hospita TaxID=169430 RepID=UPI003ECEFB77
MTNLDPPRPTLEDVAKLARVSLGSASRALSVPDQVKPKTLAQVKRAVEQLGYVSNGAARALASKRTRTIGAIYPTMYGSGANSRWGGDVFNKLGYLIY